MNLRVILGCKPNRLAIIEDTPPRVSISDIFAGRDIAPFLPPPTPADGDIRQFLRVTANVRMVEQRLHREQLFYPTTPPPACLSGAASGVSQSRNSPWQSLDNWTLADDDAHNHGFLNEASSCQTVEVSSMRCHPSSLPSVPVTRDVSPQPGDSRENLGGGHDDSTDLSRTNTTERSSTSSQAKESQRQQIFKNTKRFEDGLQKFCDGMGQGLKAHCTVHVTSNGPITTVEADNLNPDSIASAQKEWWRNAERIASAQKEWWLDKTGRPRTDIDIDQITGPQMCSLQEKYDEICRKKGILGLTLADSVRESLFAPPLNISRDYISDVYKRASVEAASLVTPNKSMGHLSGKHVKRVMSTPTESTEKRQPPAKMRERTRARPNALHTTARALSGLLDPSVSVTSRMESLGLSAREVGGGGDCFYHSVSWHLWDGDPSRVREARNLIALHLQEMYDRGSDITNQIMGRGQMDDFLQRIRQMGVAVEGEVEMQATADVYQRNVFVYGRSVEHDRIYVPRVDLRRAADESVNRPWMILVHYQNPDPSLIGHYRVVETNHDDRDVEEARREHMRRLVIQENPSHHSDTVPTEGRRQYTRERTEFNRQRALRIRAQAVSAPNHTVSDGPQGSTGGTSRATVTSANLTYLRSTYEDRQEIKTLGAVWDKVHKRWYVPAHMDLSPFRKWLDSGPMDTPERTYLFSKFEDKEDVKRLGARFDCSKKKWYVPQGVNLQPFDKWLKPAVQGKPDGHIEPPWKEESVRPFQRQNPNAQPNWIPCIGTGRLAQRSDQGGSGQCEHLVPPNPVKPRCGPCYYEYKHMRPTRQCLGSNRKTVVDKNKPDSKETEGVEEDKVEEEESP